MQNTGVMKFSWCWISIRIHYSTNSKVNIHIRRMWIFFTLSHPYLSLGRFKGSGGGRPLIEWMHLKMVKILHKNASFLLKIWKNFLGRGKDLSLDPTPYFPPPPIPKFWIPCCPCCVFCYSTWLLKNCFEQNLSLYLMKCWEELWDLCGPFLSYKWLDFSGNLYLDLRPGFL